MRETLTLTAMEFDDVKSQGNLFNALILVRSRNAAPLQHLAEQRVSIRESWSIKSSLLRQGAQTVKHSDYQG